MDDTPIFDNKHDLLTEMIKRQREVISQQQNYGRLSFKDLKRLEKYLPQSIFDTDECVIYSGYINKKLTSGFSYNKKKVLVNRILYHNFIDELDDTLIIENTCQNKGICCSLQHLHAKKKKNKNQQASTSECPPLEDN